MKTLPINIKGFSYPELIKQAAKTKYNGYLKAYYKGTEINKTKFISNIHLDDEVQRINITAGNLFSSQKIKLYSNGDSFVQTNILETESKLGNKFFSFVIKNNDGTGISVMRGRKGHKAVISGIKDGKPTTIVYSSNTNPEYNEVKQTDEFFKSLLNTIQNHDKSKEIII